MHRISSLRVENFKSIKDFTFPLEHYSGFVGYNNAGKTNILRALNWIVKKSVLSGSDFRDQNNSIIVEADIVDIDDCTLSGIGEAHRSKIEEYIENGKITVRRIQPNPNCKIGDIKFEMKGLDGEWKLNPSGIDNAVSGIFPDPIFIEAMENAADDVRKFGATTTIGKLIKEIIYPISENYTQSVEEALMPFSEKLSAGGQSRDSNLVSLDNRIESELNKFFTGIQAKVHIPTPNFSDFVKNATIKIFEEQSPEPQGRDILSLGHGSQRTIQISLIKCLSDIKKESRPESNRTTLLLIDEPELYLHPQAVEMLRDSLKNLSNQGYQVAFTTHSPMMIQREDAKDALLIRKGSDSETIARPRIRDTVEKEVNDSEVQAEIIFSLTNSSKILFLENIILAEGATEKAILPDLYKYCTDKNLSDSSMGLIDVGGVGSISSALRILKSMGVRTKAIVDLDFAFRDAVRSGLVDSSDVDLLNCMSVLEDLKSRDEIDLESNGLPCRHKGNGTSAAQAYEILASEASAVDSINNLHQKLLDQDVWIWKGGCIEVHLHLASKSPQAWSSFVRNLNDQAMHSSLPDYKEARALFDWLHA